MKTFFAPVVGLATFLAICSGSIRASAQGTEFTYQGRLTSNGDPYSGPAEFMPTLWNAPAGGSALAANNPATVVVGVTNGLFVLPLDFGAGFPGADRWLQLEVRTVLGPFTLLSPRQKISPTPYAIHSANAATALTASSVPAGNITGTLSLAQLPGMVVTNSQNNVNLTGTFTGDGGALTNINASALTTAFTNVALTSWGWNHYGQRSIPPGLGPVIGMSAGPAHSLVVKADGTVAAWGAGTTTNGLDFEVGQSIVPAGLAGVAAVAAGYFHSVALRSNGTVVAWGGDSTLTNVPGGLSNVRAIAAGFNHTLALRNDGTVTGWGTNSHGQLDIPAGLNSVARISAGLYHSVALRSNGTVVVWGGADYGETNVPPGLNNVAAVQAGGVHTLALKSDGTVVAWGAGEIYNPEDGANYGQSIVPPGLSNVVALACGLVHSVALKSDGTVVSWGSNLQGEQNIPPGLNNIVGIGGGLGLHILALRKIADGPVAWIDSDNTFNGSITVNGDLRVSGEMLAGGGFRLDDANLWFRKGTDTRSGLGWHGEGKTFGSFAEDGPVLFGHTGGGLGTTTNGQKVAVSWDSEQRVGIGTTTPGARLSLGDGFAESKLLLYDSSGSRIGIGVHPGHMRFHLGSGANRYSFHALPTGPELLTIQGFNGFVGIGTNSPEARLHVFGNVRLGSSGQLFAPGGQENLRIIRGVVLPAGGITEGEGFSVTKTGTGAYTVTFSSTFLGLPAVTVSAQSGVARMATTTNVAAGSFQVRTFDAAGNAIDAQFHFIAIGER